MNNAGEKKRNTMKWKKPWHNETLRIKTITITLWSSLMTSRCPQFTCKYLDARLRSLFYSFTWVISRKIYIRLLSRLSKDIVRFEKSFKISFQTERKKYLFPQIYTHVIQWKFYVHERFPFEIMFCQVPVSNSSFTPPCLVAWHKQRTYTSQKFLSMFARNDSRVYRLDRFFTWLAVKYLAMSSFANQTMCSSKLGRSVKDPQNGKSYRL